MPINIDWNNKIVQITSPTTEIDGQTLHDYIEDQMATPRGSADEDILKPEGKIEDPTNPGVYSQIILVLSSLWQIQFWAGSGYTKIYGAKIVGGVSDQPMKATGTANDITVLESPVDGVTVGTVGATAAEVWAYLTRTLTAGTKDAEIDAIKTKTDDLPDDPVTLDDVGLQDDERSKLLQIENPPSQDLDDYKAEPAPTPGDIWRYKR